MADAAEFQWTTYALVLGIAAVGYVGYAIFPAFVDNMDASQQIHAVVNDGWRRIGKDEIQKRVLEKLSTIGSHVETPAGGAATVVRGLPVTDDDVIVTCTDQDQDCSDQSGDVTVSVHYARHMPLPWLKGKFITLHFSPSANASLAPVNWN
ncbi:MAG TPA: hypothetical protein VMB50_15660 [Myxococcales bacterium]|nr:hypothetical protein [Myxococcales bacterium]